MSETLYLIATIYPTPGKEIQARAAFEELITATRNEVGCELYDLTQAEGESVWIMMEKWTSKADWDAHMESEHVKKIISNGPNFLSQPSELRILKAL
jgi:quinol monooxygenase YgiN